MTRIGVPTFKRKTFPIWHQDSTDNPNYTSEYKRCLDNFPVDNNQANTVESFGSISFTSRFSGGGIVAPNGKIYWSPFSHDSIGVFDPSDNSYYEVTHGVSGTALYAGGCLAPNGCIYFVPYQSLTILKIDPSDDTVTTIGTFAAGSKWRLPSITQDGIIYGIPRNTTTILKLDTNNDTYSEFGSLGGGAKWTGSVLGFNGCIYGIPLDSTQVIKVDPSDNDSITLFGSIAGGGTFTSGAISKEGIIYCPDYTGGNMGRIDTNNDTVDITLTTNMVANQYGIVMAPNGKFYTAQYSGGVCLEIDPNTNTITQLTNSYNGYEGINVAFNGKLYMTPRDTTKFTSVMIKAEGGVDKDFCLSRYVNK